MISHWKNAAKFSCLAITTAVLTWLIGNRLNWAKEPPAAGSSPATQLAKGDDGDAKTTDGDIKNDYELMKLFVDTLDQIERNYVQDISRRELVEAAIQGMLSKLDQHTNYISPQDLDQFKTGVESEFGGIGIHVKIEKGELMILGAVPNSPAQRAGLAIGDVITHVETKAIKGLQIEEATQLLKGKSGTSVEFAVRRTDGKSETMKLTREVVRMDTVLGWKLNDKSEWDYWYDGDQKLGYVRIVSFSRHTADDLRAALEDLTAHGMRGLILDLRMNPGGLLSSAIEVSDLFVAEGRIVSTSGRKTTGKKILEEKKWDAHRRGTFEGFPIAVLVNRWSASASEIVAACIQDHHRGIVVGERTWGKGSVQNVVELEGGHSALKLTTAKYYRPNGKDINRDENEGPDGEWGVQPDDGFEIKASNTDLHELVARFRSHEQLRTRHSGSPWNGFADPQLARAVEHLKEKSTPTP